MMKRYFRKALILLMTGTFVSATQAALARPGSEAAGEARESCFTETDMLDLSGMTIESGAMMPAAGSQNSFSAADTFETYEIELEDEGKKGINYKAIIGYTIAAAFIGYALYILIVPDEEEEEPELPGKEPPVSLITIPFGG